MQPKPAREAKDHVFVDLFNQPKYCLELFRTIHPEMTDITQEDIQNISISHVGHGDGYSRTVPMSL